jgi:hypothetical protein
MVWTIYYRNVQFEGSRVRVFADLVDVNMRIRCGQVYNLTCNKFDFWFRRKIVRQVLTDMRSLNNLFAGEWKN